MKKLSFFAVFAALALPQVASAQQSTGLSSMGEDFYFTELAPSIKCAAIKQFQAYYLLISAPYDCGVTVSYFDALGEHYGVTHSVNAKSSFQLPLDQTFMNPLDRNSDPINPDGETPMYSSCHIHSSRPI
ncbi:MAG TPA: hypothetical protein VFX22_09025, partial [Candidatus Kapabacteria bacterium]|nr:hypothetical protein [Candidatus Kapabacteria bacterium]